VRLRHGIGDIVVVRDKFLKVHDNVSFGRMDGAKIEIT
jgi:hypothetical protein